MKHFLALIFILLFSISPALGSDLEAIKAKALSGDSESQYNLGWIYQVGDGVKQDHKIAFKWFLKAAELGHIEAQIKVGAYL